MKPFYWFTRLLLVTYFTIFHRHKVYGLNHVLKGKGIIAPNHASFLDPPLIAASWPEEVSFLARKTLFSKPILGTLINNLNAHPITGTAQDLNSMKMICKLLQEDKKVVIFPEGIRSHDGHVSTVKSGIGMLAFRSQSPIIPIYIHGTFHIWNRKQRFPKLWGKTACVIGSPINFETFSHLTKKEAQEVLSTHVKLSIVNLKTWYDNGANGNPP